MQQVSIVIGIHGFPFLWFTVSDFTESLAQLYEKHAEELQVLVSNYRKKNGELRKEVNQWLHYHANSTWKFKISHFPLISQRPPCQSSLFHAWETFLQEVEADSQSTSEMSNLLSKQVSFYLIRVRVMMDDLPMLGAIICINLNPPSVFADVSHAIKKAFIAKLFLNLLIPPSGRNSLW